jgi:hypothetical protein
MILRVHLPGAADYTIGDEIWEQLLAEAITAEAETIADAAGSDLLTSPDQAHRDALRDRVIAEMTAALVEVGDEYRSPEGVLYSLLDEKLGLADTLRNVSEPKPEPIVLEVLRFENLPPGSAGSRRVIVRWSDGTESDAITFYADEVLSPVDHAGRQ